MKKLLMLISLIFIISNVNAAVFEKVEFSGDYLRARNGATVQNLNQPGIYSGFFTYNTDIIFPGANIGSFTPTDWAETISMNVNVNYDSNTLTHSNNETDSFISGLSWSKNGSLDSFSLDGFPNNFSFSGNLFDHIFVFGGKSFVNFSFRTASFRSEPNVSFQTTRNSTWKTTRYEITDNNGYTPVPQPTTVATFALGLIGLAGYRFRKNK